MRRLPLDQLARRCQKPDHRRVGNWMARHISRPLALRVTWVVAPWGLSAHGATLLAWAVGLAAAAAFALGTPAGWIAGAALLQLWYLLDHVDGQLARLRGAPSLDGAQLDYLMHHTVNLLVPCGVGFGLFVNRLAPVWLGVGLAWGVGLLLVTLQHDTRYKAFAARLGRVRGRLIVQGGAVRPTPQPPLPRQPLRLAAWTARKLCEAHVVMNVLLVVALVQAISGDRALVTGRVWTALAAGLSVGVAAWTLGRSLAREDAAREFAAWVQPPPARNLVLRDGWWIVERDAAAECSKNGQVGESASNKSS